MASCRGQFYAAGETPVLRYGDAPPPRRVVGDFAIEPIARAGKPMLKGLAAGLGAGALWAMVFVAPRIAAGIPAVDLTAGRFVCYGALSLALMLAARRSRWPDARQALAALCMSLLGFTGYYLLLVLAIRDAGVEVPSLIIGTIPLWMMLLGRPREMRFVSLLPGLVLTLAGLLMLTQASTSALPIGATTAPRFWRGLGYATVSMALWTAFGLLNAAWLKRNPGVDSATWANWMGVATGLGALLLWLAAGSDAKALLAQPQLARAAVVCIVTGVGSAWLATVLWNIASRRVGPSLCGQLIVSETVLALFYSFLWEGQLPSLLQAAACVLFVAGILASLRAHYSAAHHGTA